MKALVLHLWQTSRLFQASVAIAAVAILFGVTRSPSPPSAAPPVSNVTPGAAILNQAQAAVKNNLPSVSPVALPAIPNTDGLGDKAKEAAGKSLDAVNTSADVLNKGATAVGNAFDFFLGKPEPVPTTSPTPTPNPKTP